jgi:8-oxo-dGTP diphosphatase
MTMKLATLCYLRRAGKTLMIYRNKKPNDMHMGKWNGLGGKLEPGETPEECAVREIFEESGLRVKKLVLRGFLTFPQFSKDEDWYAFVYLITDFSGSLINSPEGELRWIDNSKLLDLNLWEGDRIFLPWLDRPGIFSGKFTYKEGKLIEHQAAFYSP